MINGLQHLALGVPDLAPGADFYETFGLSVENRADHLAFRCKGRAQDQIVLVETGQSRRFHHVSFGADAAGLEAIAGRLHARGVQLLPRPFAGAAEGLWFLDPDGHLVNVQVADNAGRAPEPGPVINSPGLNPRAGTRGCPTRALPTNPRRLGHLILFTPDVTRKLTFYCQVLGMKVSDTLKDEYGAFLRIAGDSDHHVIGFLNSPAPGFHHASFEMASVDEAELAAVKLKTKGYKHAWGPGRHAIGSNYFHYFRDPWNGMCEYYYDMDHIPAQCDWEAIEWTKQDGMFLWSADGPPPPDFGRNYEID